MKNKLMLSVMLAVPLFIQASGAVGAVQNDARIVNYTILVHERIANLTILAHLRTLAQDVQLEQIQSFEVERLMRLAVLERGIQKEKARNNNLNSVFELPDEELILGRIISTEMEGRGWRYFD